MTQPVPLSYLIRESQQAMANKIASWWQQVQPTGYRHVPPTTSRKNWLPKRQIFELDAYDITLQIVFDHHGFDPALSTWSYGKTRILSDQAEPIPGASYMFDNTAHDDPLDIDLSETVTYSQSRSTTMSHETEIDIGVEADQKVTIGGDNYGGKLEAEFKETLGIGTKDAQEKAESEDKGQSRTQDVKTTVIGGKATVATVESPNVQSLTPFSIDGVWDAGLALRFNADILDPGRDGGWLGYGAANFMTDRSPRVANDAGCLLVSFTDWNDWLEMLDGVNTEFPAVNHPLGGPVVRGSIADAANRRIVWSGTQHRQYQKVAEYTFADVAPDEVDDTVERLGIDTDHIVTS